MNAAKWGEGGGNTSIWRPDDVSLSRGHPIVLKFLIRHASYFEKVLQCIKKVIQLHFPGEKKSKPLGFAKHQKF